MNINVKICLIKYQYGVSRTSKIVDHEEHIKYLDSTISEQKQTIEEHQHDVLALSMQLQKANKEISDVMIEKQHLVIAGELIDGQIVQLKEQKQKQKLW